jgi:hypothetical protein
VAIFATVCVWRLGKLSGMFIGVAVRAVLKLDLENSDVAAWNVALRARQRGMLALQGIAACGMFFQSEGRRFESLHGMACRAFGSARSMVELASMRIWAMTIGAFLKRQLFCEVSLGVAPHTLNLGVLAQQREFSF